MDTSPRDPTVAEAELERIFTTLGGGALAGEFIREWPLGNWLIDFYFPAVKLAIEVDGGYHRAPLRWRRDLHKAAELDAEGITLLRLTNAEVFGERQNLIEKLRVTWRVAQVRTTQAAPVPPDRFRLREPAAPAYAVALAPGTGTIDMIFVKELALLQMRAVDAASYPNKPVRVIGGTQAEMTSFLDAERARWKKVIDTAKVTLD